MTLGVVTAAGCAKPPSRDVMLFRPFAASSAWNTPVGSRGTDPSSGAVVGRLAGVVRTQELVQGVIPHALVFSTDSACPDVYRYPATKTDGASWASPCIPEGARVQLDPSLNVDALPGLTAGERTIAKALQTY